MGSNSKTMHKFSLALGVIIAITVMMAIPITNFDVVKAYSCSSSSSAVHTPGTSTSVSGEQRQAALAVRVVYPRDKLVV